MEASKLRKIGDCKGKIKEIIGDDEVIQLAKDGICPHYIIINPLTKEESIWFIASELNQWFEANFVKYRESGFVQDYIFIHFNKENYASDEGIPLELSNIKELYHLPMQNICTLPGIYFLCKKRKIKYIGQAVNITQRVITHINERIKDFDSVYFITCPINRLTELEYSLIRYLQPELNKSGRAVANEKDNKIIESLSN